jgi:rhamnulokinase
MPPHSYLAFDLGAESGRTILGHLNNNRLILEEVTRFPNRMIPAKGHLHWDVFSLYEEMKEGMKKCSQMAEVLPETLGIATWGVDFGLLDGDGSLLSMPFTYRDERYCGAMEEFFQIVPKKRIYSLTGNQFLQFNSLFQLFALKRDGYPMLESASDLLFMPDLFNYLLTGEKKTEFTYATTSQLYNPRLKQWDAELFQAVGISTSIMQEVISPGTSLGRLDSSVSKLTGLPEIQVIAVASHDTGSAVAAAPSEGKEWAFISSGTWSCLGIEVQEPIITEKALDLNFTNEGGVEGTFRVLKNIMGLWLLQQCRKVWARKRIFSYQELIHAAEEAPAFYAFLDPDWEGFLNPPDMTEAIGQFCSKTGQNEPETLGVCVRIILESLALKYRAVLDELKELSPHSISRIHVIGGGSKNRLLCQMTANATGLPVVSGPSEATAVGNILMQSKTLGHLGNHVEMRAVIRHSFPLDIYEPADVQKWSDAYARFFELIHRYKGDS